MRVVLLAVLALGSAQLREKRTLGFILRGLVDAQAKEAGPIVGAKSPPPPARVYLIPLPERDKKSDVQVFDPLKAYTNSSKQAKKNSTTSLPYTAQSVRNSSAEEPKQFLIRITSGDGKVIVLKITGHIVEVKKKNRGLMIGVTKDEARANINIELTDKDGGGRSESVRSNVIEKDTPLVPGPDKYERLEKGSAKLEARYPYPGIQAYPYPVFLPPHYFQPLPYDGRLRVPEHLRPFSAPMKEPLAEATTTKTTQGVPASTESPQAKEPEMTTEHPRGAFESFPYPMYQQPGFQWYLQPPQETNNGLRPHMDRTGTNYWNWPQNYPYSSYLRDTLSAPHLTNMYGGVQETAMGY